MKGNCGLLVVVGQAALDLQHLSPESMILSTSRNYFGLVSMSYLVRLAALFFFTSYFTHPWKLSHFS